MTDRNDPPPNRAALLTPPGRGAVAVVAVEGPAAIAALDDAFCAADGRKFAAQPIGRVALGRFLHEDVIACKLAASSAEVHCHGGRAAAQRVLERFASAGCEIERWEDWRPGAVSQHDALEGGVAREARQALAQAATAQTAAILLDQLQGAPERAVEAMVAFIGSGDHESAICMLGELCDRAAWGSRLVDPPRIVLAGGPNVGKSSLINALVGYQRAIVFDQPGTTRDVLSAPAALNGLPFVLVDVAGLRRNAGTIESSGVELARRQVETADLVLWVIDAAAVLDGTAVALQTLTAQQIEPWRVDMQRPPATVVNKIDIRRELEVEQTEQTIAVSARTGEGVAALADFVAARLFPDTPPAGAAVPFTLRQWSALRAAQVALKAGAVGEAVASLQEYVQGAG